MIALFLLSFLQPPASPLPAQMEPALNFYVACLDARLTAGEPDGTRDFPVVVDEAIAACSPVRSQAVADSQLALAGARGFEDEAGRRAFVLERFASMDAMLRAVSRGENDPDSHAQD